MEHVEYFDKNGKIIEYGDIVKLDLLVETGGIVGLCSVEALGVVRFHGLDFVAPKQMATHVIFPGMRQSTEYLVGTVIPLALLSFYTGDPSSKIEVVGNSLELLNLK